MKTLEILNNISENRRKYKKSILKLAEQYDRADDVEKVQRYHMPDDRKGKENTLETPRPQGGGGF